MQVVDMKLNMINDENPHLMNALERSVNHPLMKIYSYKYQLKTIFHFEKIQFPHD